jgi:hypothetical protein
MADTEHHLARALSLFLKKIKKALLCFWFCSFKPASIVAAPEAPLQRPFTAEEDDLITLYFDKWGDDWEEIATALETDRQPMDVKDRWRKLREKARRKSRRASVHKVDSYGGRVHKYPVNKRFWTMEVRLDGLVYARSNLLNWCVPCRKTTSCDNSWLNMAQLTGPR